MARMTIPVQVRWSDVDAYGHVNNAAMLTLLEEARIAAFWAGDGPAPEAAVTSAKVIDAGPAASTATFIARQEIEYLAPLPYSMAPLPVQMWISHLGGASIDVCYEIPAPTGQTAARAMTTLVLVDPATGKPRRMGEAERASWQPHVDEPLTFRRRSG